MSLQRNAVLYDEISLWHDVLEKYSLNPRAHNNIGRAYKATGLINKALDSYEKALSIQPNASIVHYNIGIVYYGLGRMDEATEEFKRAVAVNPAYAEAHTNLGAFHYLKGEYTKAADEYLLSIKYKPRLFETHYNLGLTYMNMRQVEDARRSFEEALRLNPDDEDTQAALRAIK